LQPPNPKALTPATRGPCHGSFASSGRRGVPRRAAFSSRTPRVAGLIPASIAASTLSRPAPPAAASTCPMLDLAEPDRQVLVAGEDRRGAHDFHGVADRGPVAWHSMSPTVRGVQAARLIGLTQGPLLPRLVRRQQTAGLSVVARPMPRMTPWTVRASAIAS